jgi:transcriptional regulator with XRE-family HTH domain
MTWPIRAFIKPILKEEVMMMHPDWKEELARRLLTARGMESQAQVAARAGVSDRTIGLLETKKLKTPPRSRTLARLAIATGCDPMEWLSFIGVTIHTSEIESLRGSIRMKVSWEQLEPAEEIKRQLRTEFIDYVDSAIRLLEKRFDLKQV